MSLWPGTNLDAIAAKMSLTMNKISLMLVALAIDTIGNARANQSYSQDQLLADSKFECDGGTSMSGGVKSEIPFSHILEIKNGDFKYYSSPKDQNHFSLIYTGKMHKTRTSLHSLFVQDDVQKVNVDFSVKADGNPGFALLDQKDDELWFVDCKVSINAAGNNS